MIHIWDASFFNMFHMSALGAVFLQSANSCKSCVHKLDFVHCMLNCSFLQGETPNGGGTACCLEGRKKFDIRRTSFRSMVCFVARVFFDDSCWHVGMLAPGPHEDSEGVGFWCLW